MTDKIQSGVMKVVSKINNIDIPSMPNLKLKYPLTHCLFSINWKSAVEVSKENHKKIASKKFAKDVNIATYFVLSIALSEESFIKRIKKDPTRGRKVTDDNIGKFI